MTTAAYDTEIGSTYDSTRKADPIITDLIIQHLKPTPNGKYVDIGCGTGNYTKALSDKGYNLAGIDLSEQMLKAAKAKSNQIKWILGSARETNFSSNSFDGAVCTLALHLIGELEKTVAEVYRILSQGHFVTFTFTPEMIRNYWLCHYFPRCMQKSAAKMHSEKELVNALKKAGFQNIQKTPYFVTPDVQDCFLYTGKHNPSKYLAPETIANISAFSMSNEENEIKAGLNQLQKDIQSGEISRIIESCDPSIGDCLILSGEKRQ